MICHLCEKPLPSPPYIDEDGNPWCAACAAEILVHGVPPEFFRVPQLIEDLILLNKEVPRDH